MGSVISEFQYLGVCVSHGDVCESNYVQCLPYLSGMNKYFQPFYQPNECGKALCVRPDVMELDELYEFPEYSRDPTMYLALRNLILALWYSNCKVRKPGIFSKDFGKCDPLSYHLLCTNLFNKIGSAEHVLNMSYNSWLIQKD